MNLPKKTLSSQRGQILILFLLVLVLGLAIVLSVASRTVTDLRTSTTSDESNRAYFAAEAGLEEALQEIESTGSLASDLSLNFTGTNTTATTQVVAGTGEREVFVYPFPVERDDVAQVMMLNDANGDGQINNSDLNSGWCPVPPNANSDCDLTIYWGDPSGVNGNDQAIEVSVFYHDGSFKITKFGFDPVSSRVPDNNFCSGAGVINDVSGDPPLADSVTGVSQSFNFSTTINFRVSDPVPNCSDANHGGTIAGANPVFLRVRSLYNTDPIPIAVQSVSPVLPNQAFDVESTGQTVSGVTRKIKASSLFPALPGFFDYVLFNAGSSSLTKP